MNKTIPLAVLSAIFLSGCAQSTLKPIASNPPYKEIQVNTPFSWGANNIFLIRVDYPKGKYMPIYEDNNGYYYQAPQKLTGSDSGMGLMIDGGLYLEKNKITPEKLYFIRSPLGVPATVSMEKKEDVSPIE